MSEKRIRFVVDNKGNHTMETLEGFSGSSCVEQTKNLELAIGGVMAAEGKTDAYYRPEDEAPVTIGM